MMAPSSDKVGRQFPLAVYVPVDLGPVSGNAATLYGSHQAFFAGARQAAGGCGDAVRGRAGQAGGGAGRSCGRGLGRGGDVPAPGAGGSGLPLDAGAVHRRWAPAGAQYYAFRTFMMACAAERGKEPSKPGVTLDCPFPEETGPYPWVEMARRMLQWRGMTPALFWHQGPPPAAGVAGAAVLDAADAPGQARPLQHEAVAPAHQGRQRHRDGEAGAHRQAAQRAG